MASTYILVGMEAFFYQEAPQRAEQLLTNLVVTKLIENHYGKGHVVIMDNFFTSCWIV